MSAAANFLDISRKMFLYYKGLADKSMAVLQAEDIHYAPGETSNSIAVLVHHMSGNMLSRFTDFLTSDGEKEGRNRDAEFEDPYTSKEEMMQAWQCLFNTLDALSDTDMTAIVYIRNEGHTVLEAITRQVAHYAYHTGQIVFLAKQIRNGSWQSLSIPKGGSGAFNRDKFDQEKERRFFTDKKE